MSNTGLWCREAFYIAIPCFGILFPISWNTFLPINKLFKYSADNHKQIPIRIKSCPHSSGSTQILINIKQILCNISNDNYQCFFLEVGKLSLKLKSRKKKGLRNRCHFSRSFLYYFQNSIEIHLTADMAVSLSEQPNILLKEELPCPSGPEAWRRK